LTPLNLLELRFPLARELRGFQRPVPDQGHEVTAESVAASAFFIRTM
jgi:hypothetical protein